MRWGDYRGRIASVDEYVPSHPALKMFMKFANCKLITHTLFMF